MGLRWWDFAPRKSDDTAVVPPHWWALLRQRRDFPARQRGLVGRMGAGLRPAKVGRHGGRPSKKLLTSTFILQTFPRGGCYRGRTCLLRRVTGVAELRGEA
jgi:hypothetical protein